MWQMMFKYLPEDKYEVAYNQLKELEAEGREHGSKYDLTSYKTALQTYVNNYNHWDNSHNWQAMEHQWCKGVGRAQCGLTAALAQELCRKDRSFHPSPTFKDKVLPRVLEFYNYITDKFESLFPLAASSSSVLGGDFAIIRGGARSPHTPHGGLGRRGEGAGAGGAARGDLAAITAYDVVRTQERVELTELLAPKPGSAQRLTR